MDGRTRRNAPRAAVAAICVGLALAAACLAPGTAWAQTVQFENGQTADLSGSGAITGTCSTVVNFIPLSDVVDHFDVFMPDGQIVRGECIDFGYAVPSNAAYSFVATPVGGGTYSVLVNSGLAEWVVFGDGHVERGAPDPSQRIGRITWTPRIVMKGAISLVKESANPALTANNACYSLEGATYGVFGSREDAQEGSADAALATFATDANGVWTSGQDFEAGTYYVAETDAPAGYARDRNVYAVQVEAGQTVRVNASAGSVSDIPQSNPVTIWARKGDADMPEGLAQGGATLAGAQFTVRYYDGYHDAASLPATPTRTWVVATDADGTAPVDDAHKVGGDDFYRTADGRITLPLGTVTIEETQAPEGYLPDEGGLRVMQIRGDGETETVSTYNAPRFSDAIMRGGVAVAKTDRQTDGYLPQGAATLEGAVFTIVSANDQPIRVGSAFYSKGDVVSTVVARLDGNGRAIAATAADCLPYGTYTVYESESPEGYVYDDASRAWSRTFSVAAPGQLVDLTDVSSAADNRVVRGDFAFSKVDGLTGARLAGVAFLVTSYTTGESHVVVTDANGMVSTAASWNAHTANTNANDAALAEENGMLMLDEQLLDPTAGLWFSGRADASCPVDDGFGALPYDTYAVSELRTSTNEGYELAAFDVVIERDGRELDLGTVDDNAGAIVTTSLSDGSGVRLASAGGTAIVVDAVGFANLDMREQYTMLGTMHLVNDDGSDGGIVAEASTSFQPTSSAGTVDVEFALDTTVLEGARLVAFEQIVDSQGIVQAAHEDLAYEGQTVRVPAISTTLVDGADGDHAALADGDVELVDTVSYQGLTPGDAYTLTGTLHLRGADGSDAGVALDAQGREITARQSFIAETSSGTVDVTFSFKAPDLGGRTLVAFETLERKDNVYATHADIADEGQSVTLSTTPPEPIVPDEPKTPETVPVVEKKITEQPSVPTKATPEKAAATPKTGDDLVFHILLVLVPAGAIGLALAAISVRRLDREMQITIERGKPRR